MNIESACGGLDVFLLKNSFLDMNTSIEARDPAGVEKYLQYEFSNKELLHEALRHSSYVNELAQENLQDIHIDDIGNVFGRLPGSGSDFPIVVSAHLDTVFPVHTDLLLKRQTDRIAGPGRRSDRDRVV